MKKIIFIFAILVFVFFITSCSDTPYSGQYISSNNMILKLDSNNNCTIINSVYKEAFFTKGKYIVNNGNIDITFDDKKSNSYGISSLKGKIEGSRIVLYNSYNKEYYTFSKE